MMINAMRTLALDYLIQENAGGEFPVDCEKWYKELRENHPEKIFPYLIEDSGKVELVYILEKVAPDLVNLSVQELVNDGLGCTPDKLPFMKPSGNRSPAVGPVIKRTYSKKEGAGPTRDTIRLYLKYFNKVAQSNKPWAVYFADIIEVLNCPFMRLLDGEKLDWQEAGYSSLLECAVEAIGDQNKTVFLTVKDSKGQFPGEEPLYFKYLLTEKLSGDERYVTKGCSAQEKAVCPLCNGKNITIFPNALKGAGINIINLDRLGVFPGIKQENAWKNFALCSSCADLLYVYKNHVLKKIGPKKDRRPFQARIAGELALIIPHFLPGLLAEDRADILVEAVNDYIARMETDIGPDEDYLLETLKDKKSILNLNMLWVDVGQNIENVTGMLINVLPSRLYKLSEINTKAKEWQHPLFPEIEVSDESNAFKPDLSLQALRSFFHRPGGKKAKDINNSKQLFELKRHIADCIYHKKALPENRFWDELMITARWYVKDAVEEEKGYLRLLYEGDGKKGPYLTAAGWIKHVNWWLYYFKEVGIMEKGKEMFEPQMAELKPYFGLESGIDQEEKAFAFLLGVLYGKLLEVQGARGVNVGANALTWLKKLTLKGKDLPELYTKVRAKLLAYETEKNEKVRNLISEIGVLGVKLGDRIELNEVQTNYYLLLGQSMTVNILKK